MAVLKGKRQVLLSCREQALISDLSTQPSMLTPAYSTTTLVQKAGQPRLISVPVTFLKSNPQPQIHRGFAWVSLACHGGQRWHS